MQRKGTAGLLSKRFLDSFEAVVFQWAERPGIAKFHQACHCLLTFTMTPELLQTIHGTSGKKSQMACSVLQPSVI